MSEPASGYPVPKSNSDRMNRCHQPPFTRKFRELNPRNQMESKTAKRVQAISDEIHESLRAPLSERRGGVGDLVTLGRLSAECRECLEGA